MMGSGTTIHALTKKGSFARSNLVIENLRESLIVGVVMSIKFSAISPPSVQLSQLSVNSADLRSQVLKNGLKFNIYQPKLKV